MSDDNLTTDLRPDDEGPRDDGPISKGAISEGAIRQGMIIGNYKILAELGEGGCGVVYLAEREKPIRGRVALKVIKPGMDSRQVIARFEAERQALALMDHPNVARVLDGGVSEQGRPYFVMEYVKGIPITEHCDRQKLGINERLELFIQVCEAVQHAHQKGIIHRDIKPSNILLTIHGNLSIPKVIDFGVAKAMLQPLTERTLYTEQGQLIGTPEYMSPEQAEMTNQDIDTRTDVYSLGVVLYELLTGSLPFETEYLRTGGFDHIRRVIREEDPPTPSTRLTAMDGERITKLTDSRHSDLRQLKRELKGDLDWITLRAMEKDRTRRYETTNGLAADVRRYLHNEPVVARPPSATYRLQKLVRRNKVAFAASVAVVASLTVGLAAAVWGWADATRQRGIAEDRLVRATTAEADAVAQRDVARAALARADEQTKATRRSLYTAHMNMAQQASETESVGPLPEILDHYLPLPGQEDLRGFEWYYWWRESHRYRLSLDYEDALLRTIAMSLDGRTVAAAGAPARAQQGWEEFIEAKKYPIKTWDPISGKPKTSFAGHARGVMCMSFSPDGQIMASAGGDAVVRIWNVETGQLRAELPHGSAGQGVRAVAFFPDGKRLASANDTVRIWNVADGELAQESEAASYIDQIVVSPDSMMLAVTRGWDEVEVWNVPVGEGELKDPRRRSVPGSQCIAFSVDGDMLATADNDYEISLLDSATLNPIGEPLRGHANIIHALRFSPDGALVSGSSDGKIIFWDAAAGKPLFTLKGYGKQVVALDFSRDGTTLASGTMDGTVKLWDPQTLRSGADVLSGHDPPPECLAWSPDGRLLASGDFGGKIIVWDSASEKAIAETRHGTRCFDLCFFSDGRTLVSGGNDGVVRVWDAHSGESLGEFPQQDATVAEPIVALAASAESGLLAGLDKGGTVTLWDLQTKTSTRSPIRGHVTRGFHAMAPLTFSPSGAELATCDSAATITLWAVQSGEVLLRLAGLRQRRIHSLAISPDGRTLASAADDGTITLWDLGTGTELRVLQGASTWVRSVAFSPDGRRLASGSDDRMVTIWDVVTGEPTTRLKGHGGYVHTVGFSPDGSTVASTSDDGTVRLWRAATPEDVRSSEPK